MINSNKIITNIITILLIISAYTMRPTVLGQNYTNIAMILLIVALIIFFAYGYSKKYNILNLNTIPILIMCYIFWIYLGFQAIFLNNSNIDFVLKSIISNIISISVFSLVLEDDELNYKFFKIFIVIIVICCVSYIITFIINIFIDIDKIYLFRLPVRGYNYESGKVYIPFTISYGKFLINNNFETIRLLGLFRESGIFQCFIIWSIFICDYYFKSSKIIKLILVFGLFGTFSTISIINLFFAYALNIILNKKYSIKKYILAFCVLILGVYLIFNMPYFGIKGKLGYGQASITDRLDGFKVGENILREQPLFGNGYFYYTDKRNTGINLISSIGQIGLLGLFLYFLIYLLSLFSTNFSKKLIVAMSPIIITLLFSQPIFDAPLIFILLLIKYQPEKIKSADWRMYETKRIKRRNTSSIHT
ncbi:hypothetical protein CPJCM30710_00470 [Clostridium polyendosporum]|uniref:Uncharacterized protein n=1 Tax=Clostridium polyendosporum TaxID=69208 RepID=A0A919RVX2_9CLOT|nr:hypothetical protein [Clostridium polyendosporum]GIM27381.1 hypothetical protein CPJCM30710_00470 [Clostridium polyendosporum]